MADLTTEQVQADLQHFNGLAKAGKNIQCELSNLPPGVQLQLVKAVARPENSALVTDLRITMDGDMSGSRLHLDSKKPSTEACSAEESPQSAGNEQASAGKRRLSRSGGTHGRSHAEVSQELHIPPLESATDRAKDIEKFIDGDLKQDDQSKGWLRKKLCDLMQSDPSYRDQVLAQLEKDGASVQREGANPVSIKFSQYWGVRKDTIPLDQPFEQLAKSAESKWDAGVEQATHVSLTAAAAILRQQQKESGTLTEQQKYWFEKPYAFQN